MAKPRVILADDHTLLLEAFEKLLAAECDVVAKVPDGRALVAAVQQHRPDLVVLDLSMPLLNGLEAARQIKAFDKNVRLVFVTMNEDPDLAAEAFRAGGSAYLLKRSAGSELLTAIREAMKHRSYVTPLVTEGMLGSLMHATSEAPSRQLTPRQREVLPREPESLHDAVFDERHCLERLRRGPPERPVFGIAGLCDDLALSVHNRDVDAVAGLQHRPPVQLNEQLELLSAGGTIADCGLWIVDCGM